MTSKKVAEILKEQIAATKEKLLEVGDNPALREIFGKHIDDLVDMLARMAAGESTDSELLTEDAAVQGKAEWRTVIPEVLNRPDVGGSITENDLLDVVLREELFWPGTASESDKKQYKMRGKRMGTLRQAISSPFNKSYFHRLGDQIVVGPSKDGPDMPSMNT
jgi:hypothetical protein